MKRHKPKKYCECGFPQSSPTPHNHTGKTILESLREQNGQLQELLERIHGRPFSHKLDMISEIHELKNVLRYVFNNVVMCKGEIPQDVITRAIQLYKEIA
jgi:NCAIR mutase (PurE)-related protein